MGFLASTVGALFIVALFLGTSNGQQQQTQCAQRFDQELSPTCFDPRGLTFQGVLFLITQNVSGGLPPGESVASYRQKVCQMSEIDFIIPCILQFKAQFTNATCSQEEVAMIDASGRQLLMMTERMCMEPCEMNIRQSLSQCFVSAQISPDRFLNTSMTEDKFPLIGNTTAETDLFCQARTQLFTCLKQVVRTCPSALKTLYEMGIDVQALENTGAVLCNEKSLYMDAYRCFSTPNQGIATCAQRSFTELSEVVIGRMRTGAVKPSEFVIRLCGVRLRKVNCELQAFSQTCQPVQNELRKMAECTVLPTICKQEPQFQSGLNQMCSAPTPPPTSNTTPKNEITTPRRPHVVTKETNIRTGVDGSGSSVIEVSVLLAPLVILVHAHALS